MIHQRHDLPDHLADLLADRALHGLTNEQAARLMLDCEAADLDPELPLEFDLAAAALDEALHADVDHEPLPANLMQRIQDDAVQWRAQTQGLRVVEPDAPPSLSPPTGLSLPVQSLKYGPWLVAAAAIMLAVIGWMQSTPAPINPVAARSRLMANVPDTHTIAWADNDLGVAGDVVWSDTRQEGYLRFEGLAANAPTVEQYQLWIFDADRDERYPVDGGVFDIATDGAETVVKIDPKIDVNRATLFAITIEPPGGVVVSDRSRLILLAPVDE